MFHYRIVLSAILFHLCLVSTRSVERKPVLLRRLRSHYTINPDETSTFSPCHFYGNPTPYVIWDREKQRLSNTPTNGPYFTPDGALVLKNAQSTDSGNYTCTGVNDLGKASASATITIRPSTNKSGGAKNVGLVFFYAILVWIFLSAALAVCLCIRGRKHKRSLHRKPEGLVYENNQLPLPSGTVSGDGDQPTIPLGLSSECQPPEWEERTEHLCLIELTSNSVEWSNIEQQFKKTLSTANIVKIERIQNKWLWRKFISHKQAMEQKNKGRTNEKLLFHGTRSNEPSLIYNGENAFDMRLSNKGMWGQANYFAVNSSYSDSYAYVSGNIRHIFLVKVLTGDSYESPPNDSLRLPPKKPRSPSNQGIYSRIGSLRFQVERYDTVCGTTGGSQVYMTYDNEKAYPAYLIHYRK